VKEETYSIWRGNAAVVWALAAVCLLLGEALLLYAKIWRSPSGGWSVSAFYVPLMISLPFSTGVILFRKFTKLPSITHDRAMVDTCSLYLASLVLVANGTVFICIADCFLSQYHYFPR
jgi:hypothetical protein